MLNQQGGSGGKHTVTAAYNSAMPVLHESDLPIKHGYIFDGYYDAINTGTKYYNADGNSAHIWDKTSTATLYARWTMSGTDAIETGSRSDRRSLGMQQKRDVLSAATPAPPQQSKNTPSLTKTQHPTSNAPCISIFAGIGAALFIALRKTIKLM